MTKQKIAVCPDCGENYDIHFYRCPHCHRPNDIRPMTRMSYLPISRQISLFLIGLIGINLFAVIFTLIFSTVVKNDDPLLNISVNSLTYVVLFVIDLFVIGKYYNELLAPFKNGRTYIAGIIGFALLLGGSMIISLIMTTLVPSAQEGENQSVAIQMVLRNPALGIIVLGIIGPVVEELTYRIGLFTLCKRASTVLAYVVSIIIFTVIHLNFFSKDIVNELVALPDYLFAAAMFAFLYHQEGVGASLIAHIGNNLFSIIMILVQYSVSR